MSSSEGEGENPRDSRRRRIAHFRNNWGTDLKQIDEEDSGEDLLEPRAGSLGSPKSPLASRRSSTSSSVGSVGRDSTGSPQLLVPRLEWMRHASHDIPLNSWWWSKSPGFCQQYIGNESFCDCRREKNNAIQCICGEGSDDFCDWVWDENCKSSAVQLVNQGKEVSFHSEYSCGTAAVRGNKAFEEDQFFWEIKMVSPVYGTDMMIGIGSQDVCINRNENQFCSMLGEDSESWGLSYTGLFHHNSEVNCYSPRFSQGSIIGVHLDLWAGTLSFYRNRQPLGVACDSGLRGKSLYPIVTSTAARSGMRIIRSKRFKSSLQYLCCLQLRKSIASHRHVLDVVSLPPGLTGLLRQHLDWLLAPVLNPIKRKEADPESDTDTAGESSGNKRAKRKETDY